MSENVAPNDGLPLNLPAVDDVSAAHSKRVEAHLLDCIANAPDGLLPFETWMSEALYAPGLGYYAAGNIKFADQRATGDFTTAPEMTPLFGRVLAKQIAEVLEATDTRDVLEFGAGTGALAASVIPALREMGLDVRYCILELSSDLAERQAQRLQPLNAQVEWLTALPDEFHGCVLANEVLDAMPATLFQWSESGDLMEVCVKAQPDASPPFEWAERPASATLQATVASRMPPLPGYRSELNLQAEAWVRQLGQWLKTGAALLIDYGFPQREYYHPQRSSGTLMCHFRHHSHDHALVLAGIQDITAHIDFTAMADAALEGGMDVLGYTTQARFLLNAGLPALLEKTSRSDPEAMHAALSAVQKLISEAEMGELFKVLAVGRDLDPPLLGFTRGDRRDAL